jgi:single-strand DNA-binding protein
MINKVILVGRLGQDPEAKHFQRGDLYCNFSLATSKKWKDKNGQAQEKTEWHRITTFASFAESCSKYLHKGSLVYIEGEIRSRRWKDKDGNDKSMTEIIASNVRFLDQLPKDKDQGHEQGPQQAYQQSRGPTQNYGGRQQQGGLPTLPVNQPDEQMTMIGSIDEIPF